MCGDRKRQSSSAEWGENGGKTTFVGEPHSLPRVQLHIRVFLDHSEQNLNVHLAFINVSGYRGLFTYLTAIGS